MAQYKIKQGIIPGTTRLRLNRSVQTPWVTRLFEDNRFEFTFGGIVQDQTAGGLVDHLSIEGFPLVRVDGDRTVYANFLTDENGGSIVEPVAVKQLVKAAVV